MSAAKHPASPRHLAIIMDGNGRWASARHLPRTVGHSRGVDAVRNTLEACVERGIRYLTLFAFSSENWRRPADEVSTLMRLFLTALEREVDKLRENGVRLRVVGELGTFDARLRDAIAAAERITAANDRLHLTVCASYGGRWDIVQAARACLGEHASSGNAEAIDEQSLARNLALAFAPDPDLLIRTGGERRISNFLLWQLAYAELYFSELLWPEFSADELDAALAWYRSRQRRFGRTAEQMAAAG